MQLSNLPKVKTKDKKRIGRGLGSGKGKTGGRGSKGQKARGKIPASFVGGSLPFYKKLPYVRGWGNKKSGEKPVIVTTSKLNTLKAKTIVNIQSLSEHKLVSPKAVGKRGVKVLAKGELKVGLTVEVPASKKAKQMIEKAGGKVAQ
ncbi:50S ribosomal protein L15 [Candidatus Daviesbacteria bacterium]|nr:50S ribosomal protein L15 [Candidatus Daviesbacteria bacterium]